MRFAPSGDGKPLELVAGQENAGTVRIATDGIVERLAGGRRTMVLSIQLEIENLSANPVLLRPIDLWLETSTGQMLAEPELRQDGLEVRTAEIPDRARSVLVALFSLGGAQRFESFTLHWGMRVGKQASSGELAFIGVRAAGGTGAGRAASGSGAEGGGQAGRAGESATRPAPGTEKPKPLTPWSDDFEAGGSRPPCPDGDTCGYESLEPGWCGSPGCDDFYGYGWYGYPWYGYGYGYPWYGYPWYGYYGYGYPWYGYGWYGGVVFYDDGYPNYGYPGYRFDAAARENAIRRDLNLPGPRADGRSTRGSTSMSRSGGGGRSPGNTSRPGSVGRGSGSSGRPGGGASGSGSGGRSGGGARGNGGGARGPGGGRGR